MWIKAGIRYVKPRFGAGAVVGAFLAVMLLTRPVGAQVSTSSTAEASTTTTLGCIGPSVDSIEVDPTTVMPGQSLVVHGSSITSNADPCTFEAYSGPLPIVLTEPTTGFPIVTLGTVNVVDGAFTATLVVPATLSFRGPANVGYTLGNGAVADEITVIDPTPTTAPPAQPVETAPGFTG